MTAASPRVSVVMPVYNVAANPTLRAYLATAVQSVLHQDFPDWELVAVNDGSTEGTGDLLEAYARTDRRIRVLHLEKNGGISSAINQGVAFAAGPLLARMDADDISVPYRLNTQVAFLDAHPQVDIVGSGMYVINEDSLILRELIRPQGHEDLVRFAVEHGCPFVHGSVMMRRSIFDWVGGYSTSPEWDYCEDFEMWYRVLSQGRGHNLPECLYLYRQHSSSVSQLKKERQEKATQKLLEMFRKRFGHSGFSQAA